MCAARRDPYHDGYRREGDRGNRYPPRQGPPRGRGGYPERPRGRRPPPTRASLIDEPDPGAKVDVKGRPRPSDAVWADTDVEEMVDLRDEDETPAMSNETKAMIAGVLYMLMAIYMFFMFFWRDGGREFVMFEFAISLIVLSVVAILLSVSHDLKFVPTKVSVYWTNFVAGILTMIVVILMVKMFKDFSTGPYDFWDCLNVVVSVALGAGATHLLLYSMWYERKEPFVQDRVPVSFLSGFAWAGLGGFFYFFFFDEPFTRFTDAVEIFYIGVVLVVIGALSVFFNLLDNTRFAPKWATKTHMNFVSGILFGIILFMVLITALMYNSDPYELWDTIRVTIVTGIGSFAMATGVFSMGM